jgi:hypothetical protein
MRSEKPHSYFSVIEILRTVRFRLSVTQLAQQVAGVESFLPHRLTMLEFVAFHTASKIDASKLQQLWLCLTADFTRFSEVTAFCTNCMNYSANVLIRVVTGYNLWPG